MGTAVFASYAVYLENCTFYTAFINYLYSELRYLRIGLGILRTEHFAAELIELPVSSLLRALVAEHGTEVIHLLPYVPLEKAVFHHRPDYPRCAFRP